MDLKKLEFVSIDSKNNAIYERLCQPYEEEFAALTGEKPDELGQYRVQTTLFGPHARKGYFGTLCYWEDQAIGFMVTGRKENVFDVAEFFVVKDFRGGRRKNHGA